MSKPPAGNVNPAPVVAGQGGNKPAVVPAAAIKPEDNKAFMNDFEHYEKFKKFMQAVNENKSSDQKKLETEQKKVESQAKLREQLEKKLSEIKMTDIRPMEIKARQIDTGFGPAYLETPSWDPKGNGKLDCAVEMSGKDWALVMSMNRVLHGYALQEDKGDVKGITKARLAAFKLPTLSPSKDPPRIKERKSDIDLLIEQLLGTRSEEKKTETEPVPSKPEFEISDSSSISITEVKNQLQWSLAENGFSSWGMQQAAEFPAEGVTLGTSWAFQKENFKGTANSQSKGDKHYFATYNFPRIRMFLDEYSLQLSEECKKELEVFLPRKVDPDGRPQTASFEDLVRFGRLFGHLYATRVQLGGQLRTTKLASGSAGTEDSVTKDNFKMSMGLSLSSPGKELVVANKMGLETQEGKQTALAKIIESASLAWDARGGDTLLCANPPLWAGSVATFRNWRVIEQEEVFPLSRIIGRFPGYEKIPSIFQKIVDAKLEQVEENPGSGDEARTINANTMWSGRLCLSIGTRFLTFDKKSQSASVSSRLAAPPPASIFRMANADFDKDRLSKLRAEWPYFIIPIESEATDDSGGLLADISDHQLKGAGKGKKGHVFSFRRPDAEGKWGGLRGEELHSGDDVKIYCHSLAEATNWKGAESGQPSDGGPVLKEVLLNDNQKISAVQLWVAKDLQEGENAKATESAGLEDTIFKLEFL